MSSYKAQDIAEVIAKKYDYVKKLKENFNLSEWYGFMNTNNKTCRIKYIFTDDAQGNFNIHRSEKKLEQNILLFAVIYSNSQYNIFKIDHFDQKTIKIDKELKPLNLQGGTIIEKLSVTYIADNQLYMMTKINDTIYGIYQRVEGEKIDDEAIKALFENNSKCSYCGIAQDEIDLLNKEEEKKQNQSNIQPYGLTTRARGKKLEVDQLKPKGGYVDGNITLSCYWCNNAKTDTFSVKEFKGIARGINIAWNQKIKHLGKTIFFPENSKIWDS